MSDMLDDIRKSTEKTRQLYEQQSANVGDMRDATRQHSETEFARVVAQRDELRRALQRLVWMTAILPPDMDQPGSAMAQARAALAACED